MTDEQEQNPRWVVRLRSMPDSDIEQLLRLPLGLDIWERKRDPDVLVVAAKESRIRELERRRLASVEWLYTVEEFVSEFEPRTRDQHDAKATEESNDEEARE